MTPGTEGPSPSEYTREERKKENHLRRSVALPQDHKSNTEQRLTTSPRPLTLCSRLPVVSDRWSPTPMETHTWKESRSESRNSKRVPFWGPRRIRFKLYFIYHACLYVKCLPDEQLQRRTLSLCFIFAFHRSQFNQGWLSSFTGGETLFCTRKIVWYEQTSWWCGVFAVWGMTETPTGNELTDVPQAVPQKKTPDGGCGAERDTNLQSRYFQPELLIKLLKDCGVAVAFRVHQIEKFPPVFTLCREP